MAAETFCVDENIEHRIDFDRPENLKNYYVALGLECEQNSSVGKIGSSFFVGFMLANLILPRLADLNGRKTYVVVC